MTTSAYSTPVTLRGLRTRVSVFSRLSDAGAMTRFGAWRWLAVLLLFMLGACAGGSEEEADTWTPPVAALAQTLTRQNPAGAGTTVLVTVPSGASANRAIVPFRFTTGQVLRQCIPSTDTHVVAAQLESVSGTVVWQHRRGDPCPAPTSLAAGHYVLVLSHAATADGFTLFIQQPKSAALVAASATPGAIADTQDGEYLMLRRRDAWLFANAPQAANPHSRPVQARENSWSANALWSLKTQTVNGKDHQRLYAKKRPEDAELWVLCPRSGQAAALVKASQCDPAATDYPATDYMRSLGANLARYCFGPGGGLVRNTSCWTEFFFVLNDAFQMVYASATGDSADSTLVLNPRYRSDASNYQPKQGEVLIYTSQVDASDTGKPALVFNADAPLRMDYTRALSFRTGPNTAVAFFPGQWHSGDQTLHFGSTTSPPQTLQIASSMDVLLNTNACRSCDLSGLDLSGMRLNDVDLTGAKLIGVKAIGTSFAGAKLANADFSNAHLQDAVFTASGARAVQLNGTQFDGADLTNAQFSRSALGCVSMRAAVLAGTRFDSTKMQCVDFSGSTLNQAQFTDLQLPGAGLPLIAAPALGQCGEQRFTQVSAADADPITGLFADVPCRGLRLRAAKVWTQAPPVALWRDMDLSGAIVQDPTGQKPLKDLDLSGVDFSGGLYREVAFSGAKLNGANFDDADLTGAQLDSTQLGQFRLGVGQYLFARFARAKLRGANLSFANAKQAVFSNATLSADPTAAAQAPESRPATAVGLFAPMVDFSGADLTGVDFSSAQLYGPSMSMRNAIAVRTRFNSATLSAVDFRGARLQGADFSNANLINASMVGAHLGAADNGASTLFTRALMQGLDLSGLAGGGSSFAGATVSLRAGSIEVTRETLPGVPVTRLVRFPETKLLDTSDTTTCTQGGRGPCLDWTVPLPQQPTCVPSAEEPCPQTYKAEVTVPFVDLCVSTPDLCNP